ncbi:MAG: GNAT family N-acetyltransferase [Bacteroidota bacterium]
MAFVSQQVFLWKEMDKNVEIRLAREEDLPVLQAIGEALFDYPLKPGRALEFLKDDRHHLVLAFSRDQLVGMASGFHYVHPDKDPTLFVNEVSILDDFQNQGIGRNIVRYLVEYAGKALGCTSAWVLTENSNIPARKAYAAARGSEEREPILLIEFDGLK